MSHAPRGEATQAEPEAAPAESTTDGTVEADVVGLLAGRAGRVIVDEHAYPISLTAARAAASRSWRARRSAA